MQPLSLVLTRTLTSLAEPATAGERRSTEGGGKWGHTIILRHTALKLTGHRLYGYTKDL